MHVILISAVMDLSFHEFYVIEFLTYEFFLHATAYMLQHAYATAIPSVCLSVTCVDCIKTAEHIIEILSRSDRLIILVLHKQRLLRESDGFIPNRGTEYKG